MTENKKEYTITTKNNGVDEKGKIISFKVDVPVSEEIFKDNKRFLDKERKRRQREKRCRGKNGARCQGNCATCKYVNDGTPLSIEQMEQDGFILADTYSLEEEIVQKELHQALHDAISTLNEQDQLIMKLLGEGKTEREIAEQTRLLHKGIKTQRGINGHKEKIFAQLRELLKEYR